MTTREQIHNKAIDYSEEKENFLEYDDCGDVCDDKIFIENAFDNGAEYGYNLALEKVIGWLCMNLTDNVYLGTSTHINMRKEHIINGLVQAMKL